MADEGVNTWAMLLARWTQFAQASVALPRTAEGSRWRAAVGPIVGLQAVVFALGELEGLPADERALGRDRAGVLIRQYAGALEGLWSSEPMPGEVAALIADAREAARRVDELAG
jgi:hypothetical protein